MEKKVLVYADWVGLNGPTLVGTLHSVFSKNKEHFSFSYDDSWLISSQAQKIDPDLHLYAGPQHSINNKNFRSFLDSSPDRWGRLLMKRRETLLARLEQRRPTALNDIDYLLGVHDTNRLGALRFKLKADGPFLDNQTLLATPPLSALRELEHASLQIETNPDTNDPDYVKWLYMLMAPGSSLGGARPKASVIDERQQLWIAKFPSRYDEYDIAAWEYLTYRLAITAGITMAPSYIQRFNDSHHTFLTQRFDRTSTGRLHFTSAMTQLGYYDGDYEASYLELAQFLTEQGANTKKDLEQLWRRIVFSIAVSNTDDHLRNHGFIYQKGGWVLSPAYDLNPTTPSYGLHLAINDIDHSLDYALAFEVADFFQLKNQEAQTIYQEVINSVERWQAIATELKIPRSEQQLLEAAFNI